MAHFAQLDENNVVVQIIVVNNIDCTDGNGIEQEEIGIAFCKNLIGSNTVWKQTSYNNKIRKNYAGVNYRYDEALDAFIAPKPFPSWTLNLDTCKWVSPVPLPEDYGVDLDKKSYTWNENTLTWDAIISEWQPISQS